MQLLLSYNCIYFRNVYREFKAVGESGVLLIYHKELLMSAGLIVSYMKSKAVNHIAYMCVVRWLNRMVKNNGSQKGRGGEWGWVV